MFTEAGLRLAGTARGPLVFDVGPSTGAYGTGFAPSEERLPTTFRWTHAQAALELPLVSRGGPATMTLRAARYVDTPVRIHVAVSGRPVGAFAARPGGNRLYTLPVTVPAGPVSVALLSDDPERGVALDWIRIAGVPFTVPLAEVGPRLLPLGVALVLLLAGFPLRGALLGGAVGLIAELAWAARDPFGLAHVLARITLPALLLGAAVTLLVRGRAGGRWVAAAFLVSHLLKGAALFYPSYFYNDVRNNARYVAALREGEGTLAERNLRAQEKVGVAYPRIVAGRKYAFPYSPLFFIPFGSLPPAAVIEAIKHVAVAAAAAEVLVAFFLARALGATGAFAAVLAAVLPPLHNRLLFAMWSTTAGHLLDGLVVLSAMHLGSGAAWLRHGGLMLAALLTYISSLFNVGVFTSLQALFQPRRALRLMGLLVLGAGITVAWLYASFTVTFVREILPDVRQASPAAGAGAESGLVHALGRVVLFYGWALPAFAAAGFVLLVRRAPPERARVLAAYGSAFVALLSLRALSGGLFKDLKDVEFAAPLVALCAGAALEGLAALGRRGRVAAALALGGLLAFCVADYARVVPLFTAMADQP